MQIRLLQSNNLLNYNLFIQFQTTTTTIFSFSLSIILLQELIPIKC